MGIHMKRPLLLSVALLTLMSCMSTQQAASAAKPAAAPLPDITIYHLEGRRSERIVWLMEELGLPYKLEFKRGDLAGSMASIKAINPGMPVAPTVKYGDQVIVESGAIIETILNRHAPGKLQPAVDSPDYPYHLIWMHYAEGSLAARLFQDYRVWRIQPPKQRSPLVDSEQVVQFAEEFLGKHPWFGVFRGRHDDEVPARRCDGSQPRRCEPVPECRSVENEDRSAAGLSAHARQGVAGRDGRFTSRFAAARTSGASHCAAPSDAINELLLQLQLHSDSPVGGERGAALGRDEQALG
jgi:hypothetical protein